LRSGDGVRTIGRVDAPRRAPEPGDFVRAIAVAFMLLCLSTAVASGQTTVSHGIAMHGDLKYGPDFTHFDYVNPDAPKGGLLRLAAEGTFDSFNAFIPKGDSASTGSVETLMSNSADEPFSEYGLIAESVEVPEDRSWATFTLRPQARWHDGRPITPEDVVFSLELLKTQGHPQFRFYYQDVLSADVVGERKVKFTFRDGENRELPLIVGQLPVLPKHYWETRDFTQTTLEPPLGSGPYRVASFEPGRFIVQERVEDYWGRDLPVNRGHDNFDRIRIDYYRDASVIREALKAGSIDYRLENQAKAWALDYDVAPVRHGRLIKRVFENERPTGMQSFTMNTRREPFRDPLVRRALAYAFDFEWTNRALFFGQYTRTESFFSNSELAATDLPSEAELAILEPLRDQVPPEVFTQVYRAPSTDGSGWPRANLEKAFALLAEAGWEVRDMRLVDTRTGSPMRFEILLFSQDFERIVLPFVRNLRRLGIEARVRLVDTSQYINRVRSFDFDMILGIWGQSNSPGNEQRDFWGSEAAGREGSRNLAGIRNPAVDRLIDLLIAAPTREALVARTRALDRVLLWNHYVIPNWHLGSDRILYWDKFGMPDTVPANGTRTRYWWFDPVKAANLAGRPPPAESGTGAIR